MKAVISSLLAIVVAVTISACEMAISELVPTTVTLPAPTVSLTATPNFAATRTFTTTPTLEPMFVDCDWTGIAKAWLDDNKNGIWDTDEKPLENVRFFVDDTLNKFKNVSNFAVSDANGTSDLDVWLPGCPKVLFEVYAEAPTSYIFTTKSRIPADPQLQVRKIFYFGFTYKQGAPTATPRPIAALNCQSFDVKEALQSYDRVIVSDMAVAPDGAVWVTITDNLVARFNSTNQTWVTFSTADGILGDILVNALAIDHDGTVWVGTTEGLARFDGSSWTAYPITTQTGVLDNGAHDIAIAPDGMIWFIGPRQNISRLDPKTAKIETNVISQSMLTSDMEIYAIHSSPDGSLWFFSVSSIYQLMPGSESKWVVHKRDFDDKIGGLISLDGRASTVVSDNVLWLVGRTEDGPSVVRLNPTKKEWHTYNYRTMGGTMSSDIISSSAIAPDGSLWIGLYKTGALHFILSADNEQDGTWLYYNTDNGLLSNRVYSLVAQDGYVWFGSDKGFVTRCVEDKSASHLK